MRSQAVRSQGRFWLPATAILLVAVAVAVAQGRASTTAATRIVASGGSRSAKLHWVAAWSASPQAADPGSPFVAGFRDQTVRNVVYTSSGGSMARVQFTNTFGRRPLEIGSASVGRLVFGARLAPATAMSLAFRGRASVVIPPGAEVVSDPVHLAVRPLEHLAVSVFLPHATGLPTDHRQARQTNYVAGGAHALDSSAAAFITPTPSWFFVSRVDVRSTPREGGTAVALGDSITDGTGSQTDANRRWPNDVARRLDSLPGATLSIVDAGIGGNHVLRDTRCCGTSALGRFGRDVLSQPSATEVILLEGVNDIGVDRHLTARQLIAAYQQLIDRAHAAGLKIFGATLTPFEGAGYWTPRGEAIREAVNAWIRHSGAFDGVIDFAAAVADLADRRRFAPAYDSGDHLHPNDAGYRAMARAVRLSMLIRAAPW